MSIRTHVRPITHRTTTAAIVLALLAALATVVSADRVEATGRSARPTARQTPATQPVPGGLMAITPVRAVDTRTATSPTRGAPVAPAGVLPVVVVGRGAVPATGVAAVVVTVTVTAPTAAGYLTAWASGQPRPVASTLNFPAGVTVANTALVAVGSGGAISVGNSSPGTAHVVVDVTAWVPSGSATAAGALVTVPPTRILDTRSGLGAARGAWSGSSVHSLFVGGHAGVPVGAAAAFVNVTVTGGDTSGVIGMRDWSTIQHPLPPSPTLTSTINWAPGQTVANATVTDLSTAGRSDIALGGTSRSHVHVIVDVVGYVVGGAIHETGAVKAVTRRLHDTRLPGNTAVAPAASLDVPLYAPPDDEPGPTRSAGALLNVTVTGGTADGYLQVVASGTTGAVSSVLQWRRGQTTAGMAVTPLSATGGLTIVNRSGGSVHVVVDLLAVTTGTLHTDLSRASASRLRLAPGDPEATSEPHVMACGGAGTCAIVARIRPTHLGSPRLVLSRRDAGVWHEPITLDATLWDPDAGMACGSGSLCFVAWAAIGEPTTGFAVSTPQGTTRSAPPALPGGLPGDGVWIRSLACPTATTCVGVGAFGGDPYNVEASTADHPTLPYAVVATAEASKVSRVPLPTGTDRGVLMRLSCGRGSCTASGFAVPTGSSRGVPFTADWNGTTWTSTALSLDVGGAQLQILTSIDCTSTSCVAGGLAKTPDGNLHRILLAGLAQPGTGPRWHQIDDVASRLSNFSCTDTVGCLALSKDSVLTLVGDVITSSAPIHYSAGTHPPTSMGVTCSPTGHCLASAFAPSQTGEPTDRGMIIRGAPGSAWEAALAPSPPDAIEGPLYPQHGGGSACATDGPCFLTSSYPVSDPALGLVQDTKLVTVQP